jgi:hypothetical protein
MTGRNSARINSQRQPLPVVQEACFPEVCFFEECFSETHAKLIDLLLITLGR